MTFLYEYRKIQTHVYKSVSYVRGESEALGTQARGSEN